MGQIYKGNQLILEWWWWVTPITVDSALSTTSENPVQNKVITEALNEWLVLHSATEPATPEDWMLWYDETNKVLKIYSEDDAEWKELWEWWVTSINGNTGDITMSTGKITLTQNWEEAGHFFLDQTIDKTIELKGLDKSWKNKTVSNGELELWIRTICYPSADFTLIKPTELVDWEEYVVRFINGSTPFNMTLGHWFTNPFWVDLTLSGDAKDQFTFMAIEWILELQPAPVLVAPTENPQAPTWLEATVDGTTGTIKWTDPLDAGTNIWLNTKLVRKAWSEPTSLSDGTVVVTVTTRNQYQSTWYDDTWLTAWTTYYYRAFAEFDEWEILGSASANITPWAWPTPPTPPTPWAYTYSQIIDDAYATNWWWHIMSAELNTAPDVYFASLQASGNLSQQWSVYYISHDPTSITWNDVISWYEIFYNPSYQQWIMQMRDMTYDQIVHQATVQGTFNWLLPTLKINASTYYTNLTNSGNMVEVQNPGTKFYMCADGTASTITEIWWEKIYYIPEIWDWEIEANYGYWTYDQIIAKATADGNFYWTMMEMNRQPNGYLIDLTQSGHIYQVWDNYWLSADGTSAYNLNWTVLRYQWTFDEWSIWAA